MQNSRKLPALASVAAFAAALVIGLPPSSAQTRGGGAQNGASGYHYGGGFGGTNGAGGESGQSLNTIFRGLDSSPGDKLRTRSGDQEDYLQQRAHDRLTR